MKYPLFLGGNESQEAIKLDEKCWSCNGQESPSVTNEDLSCAICDGSGFVPTENGQVILDFISRHIK